jgi:DNA-binding MarR family transcriptional regulator
MTQNIRTITEQEMAGAKRTVEAITVASGSSVPHIGKQEILTEPLPFLIDSDEFTPRLLALLSNALVWRESMLLRQEFNLGTNDWRVISALASTPGSSATDVSEFLAMNKAVVSKAVNTLIERKLIAASDGPRGSRHLYLTPEGAQMHDKMMPISLSGEEIILSRLSERDQSQLRKLLTKMMLEIPDLSPTSIVISPLED